MVLSSAAKICSGALLTSSIFMLQMSCVFFPILGTMLSAAGTMFIAVAALFLDRHAVIVYISAGLLMLAVSPRYAFEFLTTTGFVGLALGLRLGKTPPLSLLVAGVGMFAGLCSMTYLSGTAALGGILASLPLQACLPVFAVFSAAYSIIWFVILKHLLKKPIFKQRCLY